MGRMEIERVPVAVGPDERFGRVRKLEQGREVDVEGGVFDAEREGVIDHLHLQPFLAGGGAERFLIGEAGVVCRSVCSKGSKGQQGY